MDNDKAARPGNKGDSLICETKTRKQMERFLPLYLPWHIWLGPLVDSIFELRRLSPKMKLKEHLKGI
jgi:hypothetical protein